MLSLRPSAFGQRAADADESALATAKLVVFGEVHAAAPCVDMQCHTAQRMLVHGDGQLHIVLEQCNFEQQELLDAYAAGRMTMAELVAAYNEGPEGADLAAYEPLLKMALDQPGRVRLHGGFIPRPYAKTVMRESTAAALCAAKAKGYVSESEDCAATDAHYSFFESLLTRRSVHGAVPPSERFRKMFPAQVLKDAAMAHMVSKLMASMPPTDKVLVVTGVGHSGYSHGVPERIARMHPDVKAYRIFSLKLESTVDLEDAESVAAALADAFGPAGSSNPADACLAFRAAVAAAPSVRSGHSDAKKATREAYEQVGATAHLTGNARRAVAVLHRMGYSDAEVSAAGTDGYNWQGVGCPHRHARIREGDTVLDMGSGLGIDSFIAAAAAGGGGRVVGVDLAAAEVRHANARAAARGVGERVSFSVADFERLPMDGERFDVIISNGAFCLAPDKAAAFREAHRVLKPGGRVAICLSVLRHPKLPDGVQWPLCMQMFMPLHELRSVMEASGLQDVVIDASDSLMAFEIDDASPEAAESANNQQRNRVHVGSKEFEHLKNFDMNDLCARVVVTGRKRGSNDE